MSPYLIIVLWSNFGALLGIVLLVLALRFAKWIAIVPLVILGAWGWTEYPNAQASGSAYFQLRQIFNRSEIFVTRESISQREIAISIDHTQNNSLLVLLIGDLESLLIGGNLDRAHLKLDQYFEVEGGGFLTFDATGDASLCAQAEKTYTLKDFKNIISRSLRELGEISVPSRLVSNAKGHEPDDRCILMSSTSEIRTGVLINGHREYRNVSGSNRQLQVRTYTIIDVGTGETFAVLYGAEFTNEFLPFFLGSSWKDGYFHPQSVTQRYLGFSGTVFRI